MLLSSPLAGAQSDLDFARDARPFLDASCAKCHNTEKTKGGINLDIFKDEVSLYEHRTRVEEVVEQFKHKAMPPEDAKQPEEVLRAKLAEWLTWKLENVDYARFRNPGYATARKNEDSF